ncbi:MAG: NTP transferase domain-containing protein [Deltaproteobacteria bacterium]|nr:NTP transferase domain-containing protein [Deltaproteobacteria bacterium]
MMTEVQAASIIFAAGYGSRMKGFSGNKTLLPLIPGSDPFEGEYPIIFEIVGNLPKGPKTLVIHHKKEEIIKATHDLGVFYCDQPIPNGTGGALIAAQEFLEQTDQEYCIITMGDVPFVAEATYYSLIRHLKDQDFIVLGFTPKDRAQYGIVEIENEKVQRITEWKYWKAYPLEMQRRFEVFNSGIYAARRSVLLTYLEKLKKRPHRVEKERDGKMMVVEEYFITDLVELMSDDGCKVGYSLVDEEQEVMGIDTRDDLVLAQALFAKRNIHTKRF